MIIAMTLIFEYLKEFLNHPEEVPQDSLTSEEKSQEKMKYEVNLLEIESSAIEDDQHLVTTTDQVEIAVYEAANQVTESQVEQECDQAQSLSSSKDDAVEMPKKADTKRLKLNQQELLNVLPDKLCSPCYHIHICSGESFQVPERVNL